MKVLVTGGSGYIGSHTVLALLEAGHDVVVVDNLINSSAVSLDRVSALTGRDLEFREVDLLDTGLLDDIFKENQFDAVLHFAGLKAVGESVEDPLLYYHNNLVGTLNLLRSMARHQVQKIVFSSSATVYGDTDQVPLIEKMAMDAVNPYGRTKEQIEDILADLSHSDEDWGVAILRYFNPVGAHESGQIGEDPRGIPNNLLPFVAQVASGRLEKVRVFGNDYPTPDGTGIRDYIHVVDLALGHLAALEFLASKKGLFRWNLGTGKGFSVIEVIEAFSRAAGKNIPFEVVDRRPGDAAISYSDPSKALADLGWSALRDLDQMCEDHWRWQHNNPRGYEG